MKLTRPRILLLAALLALGALLAVAWKPLWLGLAYEPVGGLPAREPLALMKRYDWLPGPKQLYPERECIVCYYANRPQAFAEMIAGAPQVDERGWDILGEPVASHRYCAERLLDSPRLHYESREQAALLWTRLVDQRGLASPSALSFVYFGSCTCPVCNHQEAK